MDSPLSSTEYISCRDRLPAFGETVLFLLTGDPTIPHVGFRDNPLAYGERHDGDSHDFELDSWWSEADDDDDSWENQFVIYWAPLPKLPSFEGFL